MNKWMICALLFISAACTQKDFIDTGRASGIFNGSMAEYMRSDTVNWGVTLRVVEYAGLTDLFEGSDPDYPEITFFGPTALSIRRYMLDNQISKISDKTPDEWKEMILKYIIPGKHMRGTITRGNSVSGGDEVTTLAGLKVRIYTEAAKYGDIPEAGAVSVYIKFPNQSSVKIASADIAPNNGIVNSLSYTYTFGKY